VSWPIPLFWKPGALGLAMHRFIDGKDRMRQALLPHSLEDYVDQENPVRVIEIDLRRRTADGGDQNLSASLKPLAVVCLSDAPLLRRETQRVSRFADAFSTASGKPSRCCPTHATGRYWSNPVAR